MDNTALGERLAGHLPDPLTSALAPSSTARTGRVTSRPRSRRPASRSPGQRGVLGRPLPQPTGCLRPSAPVTSAATHSCPAKPTPPARTAAGPVPDRSAASSPASAVWARAADRRLTAGREVARARPVTAAPGGPRPTRQPRADSPASMRPNASWPSSPVWVNCPSVATGSPPVPSAVRARGRRTGTRRPPRVTGPSS